MPLTHLQIDALAAAWVAFKRAFQDAEKATPSRPWDELPEPDRDTVRRAVLRIAEGQTPRQNHEAWRAERIAAGDATTNRSLLVPWTQLNARSQEKDRALHAVVHAMLRAFQTKAEEPGREE